MAFRFKANEPIEDGVKRIVLEQVERAIAEIDNKRVARDEAVHQVRRRCKKIRSVARLVRAVLKHYEFENAFFRNAAEELAMLRDAQVLLKTYDGLVGSGDRITWRRFDTLRRKLAQRSKKAARDTTAQDKRLGEVRDRFCKARERIGGWKLSSGAFEAIHDGLLKAYSRGRKAMKLAFEQSNATAFHEWRKHVSYHRYHVRLLRKLWRPVFQPLRRQLERLADLLGDDHDLAVLRASLTDKAGGFGKENDLRPLLDLIDKKSAELRAKARPLGKRIYAEKPKQLGRRLQTCWKASKNNENCG